MSAPAPEHEFEAAHGLPELLPAGERIIWQGSPEWRTVAVQIMHVRTVAIYFAAMLLWRGGTVFSESASVLTAVQSVLLPALLAVVALGLLCTFAWLTSRTTVYTLTNQRVVMRIGIVLSVTFNLPFRMIESASLRAHRNGTGDIALLLAKSEKIAYANLWPHARPWQVNRPEPMLRAVPEAVHVGQLLSASIVSVAPAGTAVVNAVTTSPAAHEIDIPAGHENARSHGSPLTA